MSQQSDLTQKPLARIQENVLASSERRLLTWLCAHMPAWVTPDALTATGMVGALAIFVGYAASGLSPAWLGVELNGYVIHWFGDLMYGSLARYRRIDQTEPGERGDWHELTSRCRFLESGKQT